MRYAGIDIGSERHAVAVVNDDGALLVRSTLFGEEAAGYQRLRELLGDPNDSLVAMEVTGHYWRNLFAFLGTVELLQVLAAEMKLPGRFFSAQGHWISSQWDTRSLHCS
ncbi:MAG TPA: transposase [Candidatus Binataceae bacterium]|nr:transposase [Candidatus Binataceae bacterium]